MNVYTGWLNDNERGVDVNGEPLIFHYEQVAWGYCGTGPALVAECIMVNEFGPGADRGIILWFKETIIAKLPGRDGWTLTSVDIRNWMENSA